jgi:hypothetical protein
VLVSLGVIISFALFGQQILDYLGIGIPALQGAGGLLLLLVALDLLTGRAEDPREVQDVNVALVPLGTPLLAGPGAIVATIVFVRRANGVADYVALAVAILAVHLALFPVAAFLRRHHPGDQGQRDRAGQPDRGPAAVGDRGATRGRFHPRIHQRGTLTGPVDVGAVGLVARSTVDVVNRYLTVAAGTVGACLALLVAAPAAHADAVDDAVNSCGPPRSTWRPASPSRDIDVDAVTAGHRQPADQDCGAPGGRVRQPVEGVQRVRADRQHAGPQLADDRGRRRAGATSTRRPRNTARARLARWPRMRSSPILISRRRTT